MIRKILAVDDNLGTREFYRAVFEEAEFVVETAHDATSAIIKCLEFKPDILLLDWEMPGGGGKMVFEKICELLGKKHPVLFVTGFSGKVDIGRRMGRVSILKKPASVSVLVAEVNRLLMGYPL